MATSGTVTYTQTRNEVIHDAFQLIGVYGVGRTISGEDLTFANSMLNKMIKAWQAQGIHLWAKEEGVLFPTQNTAEYTLGSGSSDAYVTKWDDAVLTKLNGALASSATAVTTDTTTGMTASDNIGIVLSDNSLHWDTIASVDSSTTLTLTTGVSGAASDNALVYTFTTRLNKPLRIHDVRRVTGLDTTSTNGEQVEHTLQEFSHQEYMDIPSKGINGTPSQWYYNPDLSDGKLYIWPRPTDTSTYLRFTYDRMLEDLTSESDNFDFPTEWLECLTYQLAVRLAPAFGKDEKLLAIIAPLASNLLESMLNWDTETSTIEFVPDRNY